MRSSLFSLPQSQGQCYLIFHLAIAPQPRTPKHHIPLAAVALRNAFSNHFVAMFLIHLTPGLFESVFFFFYCVLASAYSKNQNIRNTEQTSWTFPRKG